MHPACLNKKPNHLQNSFRKTFSKPASLKRASLVILFLQVLSPLGKKGWSLMISASSLIMSRRPCMGSGVPCTELGGGLLVAVVSWNQVGRIDLTPVTLPESVLLTLSRQRLWYIGGIIHAGTNTRTYWTFHGPSNRTAKPKQKTETN